MLHKPDEVISLTML